MISFRNRICEACGNRVTGSANFPLRDMRSEASGPVFCGLRLVTWGRAVYEAVENQPLMADKRPHSVDIMWTAKKPGNDAPKALRGPPRGSRNAFTVRNGHCRRRLRTWEAQGNLGLARVPDSGGRRAGPGRPGNWPTWCDGQARSPASHTWRGPCPISPSTSGVIAAAARPRPAIRQASIPSGSPCPRTSTRSGSLCGSGCVPARVPQRSGPGPACP